MTNGWERLTGEFSEDSCRSVFTGPLPLLFRPSRAVPPIGNWNCGRYIEPQILTLPRRFCFQTKFITLRRNAQDGKVLRARAWLASLTTVREGQGFIRLRKKLEMLSS